MSSEWTIPHEVTLIASGMFLWDYSVTLWLELGLLVGKVQLRWPLIPYFLTRYMTLGFVIGCLFFQTSGTPINCDALFVSGNLLGKVAVASASVNLAVRAVIIWPSRWYILLSIGALVTGQVILIGLGLQDRSFFATWDYELESCTGSSTSRKSDLGIFAPYALFVDWVIVILTVVGLRKHHPKQGLANVLIYQGVGFFGLVVIFQTLVTAAVFTPDNVTLVSASSTLCAVIVPMVSCYLVRCVLDGSYRTTGGWAVLHGGSTTAEGHPQDGILLTTRVESRGTASY